VTLGSLGVCLRSTVRHSHLCKTCAVVAPSCFVCRCGCAAVTLGICVSDIGYWSWDVDVYTMLEYVVYIYAVILISS